MQSNRLPQTEKPEYNLHGSRDAAFGHWIGTSKWDERQAARRGRPVLSRAWTMCSELESSPQRVRFSLPTR